MAKIDPVIINQPSPEIILVETSFGRADQMCYEDGIRKYPEMAIVEVSHEGSNWHILPNSYCRTSFVDIGPAMARGMPYALYIRLIENSDKQWFDKDAYGYDLDGITIQRDEVLAAQNILTIARIMTTGILFDPKFFNCAPNEEREATLKLYPLPVRDQLTMDFETENGAHAI